jgi:HlyD family secretion protein
MKKLALVLLVLLAAGAWWWQRGRDPAAAAPVFRTTPLARGTVVEAVSTTGALEAVTTVLVGTQVSGVINELLVDYNSRVTQGQVIARLETDVLEARVAQDEAALAAAQAAVERARVAVEEAEAKERRSVGLHAQRLATSEEVEAAGFAVRSAKASLRAEETRILQAAGVLRMARTNLAYATISSPIDGVVLDRAVDVGQTVAASLQAPTLFTLAGDLRQMRVKAAVDEADIGRVHSGQAVTFTVDAYPERRFEGRVAQRRLGPTVTANVVTYQVIVETQNPDEVLLPGMTANVSVEVARADDAWTVPVAALRFQPPAAAGDPAAAGAGGRRGGGGGRPADGGGRPGGDGKPRGPRPAQVWVLERQGEREVPRAVPVRTGPTDGSVVAIEPLEQGALVEGALILVGVDGDGGGGPGGPVNPMRLLRGGR